METKNNRKFFSGIIVYTIQDNGLRDTLRNIILTDLKGEELDQSCYGIACAGVIPSETVKKIKQACCDAEKKSGKNFSSGDFVCFYRATNSDDKENRDRIQRIEIIN